MAVVAGLGKAAAYYARGGRSLEELRSWLLAFYSWLFVFSMIAWFLIATAKWFRRTLKRLEGVE